MHVVLWSALTPCTGTWVLVGVRLCFCKVRQTLRNETELVDARYDKRAEVKGIKRRARAGGSDTPFLFASRLTRADHGHYRSCVAGCPLTLHGATVRMQPSSSVTSSSRTPPLWTAKRMRRGRMHRAPDLDNRSSFAAHREGVSAFCSGCYEDLLFMHPRLSHTNVHLARSHLPLASSCCQLQSYENAISPTRPPSSTTVHLYVP